MKVSFHQKLPPTWTCVHTHTYIDSADCAEIHIPAYIMHTCIHLYTCVDAHEHGCMHACMCAQIHTDINSVWMYACVHKYARTSHYDDIDSHVHTYTYMLHTYTQNGGAGPGSSGYNRAGNPGGSGSSSPGYGGRNYVSVHTCTHTACIQN
jgi:hypothetical protein